jgi:hypothetical protein
VLGGIEKHLPISPGLGLQLQDVFIFIDVHVAN